LASALSGLHVPDGGRKELEETEEDDSSGGSSLEELSALEIGSSSLEDDSSSSDELSVASPLVSGTTWELLSSLGSEEELAGSGRFDELDLSESAEEISLEEELLFFDELEASFEELLALRDELLLALLFHSGRPNAESHLALHFASARQESIIASNSLGLNFSSFSTATKSSVSG
jgi:hypothetical protein